RGGSFQLEPTEPYEVERRYQHDTSVLETTFTTARGSARVTDAMTLTDHFRLAPFRELARKVEGLRGDVGFHWSFDARFGYGRNGAAKPTRRAGRWFVEQGRDAIALGLWDAGEGTVSGTAVEGELRVEQGRSALLSLAAANEQPVVLSGRRDTEERLAGACRFWHDWAGRIEYDGPWRDAVVRSALTLKLLVFAPSGAIVAAPTASLPEWLGGGRNWDYRFTWLRDASWTLDAFIR